ncbi:MAG: hypothetical protein R3F61_08940 [Myxococcota bacterium]
MKRVFLVPGFFGFANLGELRYFGHVHRLLVRRFEDAGIEASVHQVRTLPTSSLKRRTQRLLEAVAAASSPGDTIDLVGHSSGGLDARMFASPGARIDSELEPWAQQVRSVLTVATPHLGTPSAEAFATASGKRMLRLISAMTLVVLRQGSIPLTVLLEAGHLFRRVDGLLEDDAPGLVDEVFRGLLDQLDSDRRSEVAAFFAEVGEDQALLPQIAPDAMDAFNVGTGDRPGVRYGCVLTRARRPGLHGVMDAGLRPYAQASNALYVACHRLASGGPEYAPAATALAPFWSDLTPADNDGMVPTASQAWGRVVAAVDADHLDVIGHFAGEDAVPPHYDWIRTGTGYSRSAFEATWNACFEFLVS